MLNRTSSLVHSRLTLLLLGIILLVHSIILTKLIYFPYPELFIYPYLTNNGLKPYSQILDQHFPGLMFFPINLDNLGMNNAEVARVWSIAIVIFIHLMLFIISNEILKSKAWALLTNFLYLVWHPFFEGWVLWIDSFLPLILLPAFYSLLKRWFFITGLLLGVGIVFKQTVIPLAGLVLVYLFWEVREMRIILKYLFGLFLPVILMLIYIGSIGVLKDFWYWTIVFNLTIFAQFGTSTPSSLGFVTRVLLVYLMSILALFHKDKKLLSILFIFIVGSLIGVFDRADFVHFQPSLPFVLLATVLGLNSIKRNWLIPTLVIYLTIATWWIIIFYRGHLSDKVFFFDSHTKLIASKIQEYTKPGEKIFIFGSVPHLYQMSKTLPAGNIFVFQFPWFMMVAQDRILEGIKKDRPQIIVSDRTVQIEGLPITDFAKKIDQYIQKNYQPIDQVDTAVILRRKSF